MAPRRPAHAHRPDRPLTAAGPGPGDPAEAEEPRLQVNHPALAATEASVPARVSAATAGAPDPVAPQTALPLEAASGGRS